MPDISRHLLREIARRIRINGIVTREEAAMLESEYVMQTDEEFHNSPEMRAFSAKINKTINAGVSPERGRTMNSWRKAPIFKHLMHGAVHVLNVAHHQNMELPDRDSEYRVTGVQFDNAITRLFFASTIHDASQKQAMKGAAAYNPED